jgi:two-component system, cell cycle response regulator
MVLLAANSRAGWRTPALATWARRAPLILGTLLFAVLACQILTGVGGHWLASFDERWTYNAVPVLAALACVVQGSRQKERFAWWLVALAIVAWGLGDIYYTFVLESHSVIPFPSPADAGYLAFYPPAYIALGLLVRSQVRGFVRSLWLDGLIAALTISALAASVVFQVVLSSLGDRPGISAAVATNLAYPLADMLLLAIVAGMISLSGWRLTRGWLLLGGGFALFGVADSVYLFRVAENTYSYGTILDLGWLAAMLLLAAAAAQPMGRAAGATLEGRRLLIVPAVFASIGLVLEVVDHFLRLNILAITLASLALAAVIGRMGMTFSEYLRVLVVTREEAVTDALTGLGNRRALMRDLEEVLEVASEADPHLLLLFDLDGFKTYNDRFGHPAGDALLARLGTSLRDCVAESGSAYRLGGDEFCAIIRADAQQLPRIRRETGRSLTEEGEGFRVAASVGSIVLPADAADATHALRLVDRRMYQEKESRRPGGDESYSVLVGVVEAHDPQLAAHTTLVARLSRAIALELGLEAPALRTLSMVARLHDIGKVAVPDTILNKPGPLDDEEWRLIRQHTAAGERIVIRARGLEEVGEAIRATHERWDGGGYPDGIAGTEIPLVARIVAVADAYEAMVSPDRPYRLPREPELALAEIVACSGTQFDPAVVEALQAVVRKGLGDNELPLVSAR